MMVWAFRTSIVLSWRILSILDSLPNHILKARYFSRDVLLYTSEGTNLSLVWQRIYKAKELMVQGIRWRFGGSRSIRVFTDPWLDDTSNFFIEPTSLLGLDMLRACDLLNETGIIWDKELIDGFLAPIGVAHILQLSNVPSHARKK
ncbi:hypothetical protein GOBAR_DD04567 [Gossypium barbadense]|nr:hypothetical protein GOBAR_DD04567 [Gossypium barbadense]